MIVAAVESHRVAALAVLRIGECFLTVWFSWLTVCSNVFYDVKSKLHGLITYSEIFKESDIQIADLTDYSYFRILPAGIFDKPDWLVWLVQLVQPLGWDNLIEPQYRKIYDLVDLANHGSVFSDFQLIIAMLFELLSTWPDKPDSPHYVHLIV